MEEKIYFCLILFSLWSIALYSAHVAVAEILIGFDCRLPAEFCVAAREAALPSRSSGGDWALVFFHNLNNIPQPNTWKDHLSMSKESISYRLLIFEALCMMTDFLFYRSTVNRESKNILAVHSECVVGLNLCSGRVIIVGWKWRNCLMRGLGIVSFLIQFMIQFHIGSIPYRLVNKEFPHTHAATLRSFFSFFFFGLRKFGAFV